MVGQVVRVLGLKYADGRERQAASEAGAKVGLLHHFILVWGYPFQNLNG